MSQVAKDEAFMREAIEEAAKADPALTRPNPRVGAVVVENGCVVARGHHERDGGPHAEKLALLDLGRSPSAGAALYVTLEPCSTEGRTGACVAAIIEAGLSRVVIGAVDPTSGHQGKARALLEAVGIEVVEGVLQAECRALNPGFAGHETGGQ